MSFVKPKDSKNSSSTVDVAPLHLRFYVTVPVGIFEPSVQTRATI